MTLKLIDVEKRVLTVTKLCNVYLCSRCNTITLTEEIIKICRGCKK